MNDKRYPLLAILPDATGQTHCIDTSTIKRKHILIDQQDINLFIADLTGWNADRFNAGLCQTQTMPADLWPTWTKDTADLPQPEWVPVSVSAAVYGAGAAISLMDKREVVAPADELPNFVADVTGWDSQAWADDLSFIALISRGNWQAWLEMFETTIDMDDDVYNSLAG